MLSTQEISSLISNPNQIGITHVPELKKLASEHPYSQVFSILLLKGLANSKDVTFDQSLKQHSFRIGNRVELFNLINQYEKTEQIVEQTAQPIVEETSSPLTVLQVEKEEIIPEKEEVVEETKVAEPITEEATAVTDQPTTPEEIEVPKDVLDESILHNAIVSNYQLDELTKEEESKLEQKENDQETGESQKDSTDLSKETPITFTSWLHADNNFHEESNLDKEAINSVVNDFEDFDPLGELTGEVEKPKTEFFSPVQKGKESLNEETLPVSETLAKIYILQGNYPKAIEAYNQLSLKFPEKKIFFANLIEDLHKKINI